jgi:DNA-binding transcriptional regulator PaaX
MAKSAHPTQPKAGTKLAELLDMLGGEGSNLRAMSAKLGWKDHTTRAAITRLRQRGFPITCAPAPAEDEPSRYRLGAS